MKRNPMDLTRYLDDLCRDAEELFEVHPEEVTVGRSNGDWVVEIRDGGMCARETHHGSLVVAFHLAAERFKFLRSCVAQTERENRALEPAAKEEHDD